MNINFPLCIVCGSGSTFMMNKGGHDLFICQNCALVFVYPVLTVDKLAVDVYSKAAGYQSKKLNDLTLAEIHPKSVQVLSFLEKEGISGRLLDVGCSNGEFLYFAKKAGFDVQGVELNTWTAEIAQSNGLPVINSTLEKAAFPGESFDVINLGDIIEHVPDPANFLVECIRILKPSGLIVISTPNLDCFWSKSTLYLYKWFNIPWSSATPPHHLFQFSFDNLNKLAKKEGLEIYDFWYNLPPRLGYELTSLGLLKKYKQSRSLKDFMFMFVAFSFYTILYVINKLTFSFRKKDFSMVMIYKKDGNFLKI